MRRRAFTLLELMIAIAIIGILLAIALPAIQQTREAARRTQCASNLRQQGVAISAFETQKGAFPPAAARSYSLLPFLGESNLLNLIPQPPDPNTDSFGEISKVVVPLLLCPTDSPDKYGDWACTNYAGSLGGGRLRYGDNGVFELEHPDGTYRSKGVRAAEIVDGLSTTVSMSEILHSRLDEWTRLRIVWRSPRVYSSGFELDEFADLCDSIPPEPPAYGWQGVPTLGYRWPEGGRGSDLYNHVLSPNRPSCSNDTQLATGIFTAASLHRGGAQSLFGDGHVEFVSASIDRLVWTRMGSRNDGFVGN